VRQIVIHSVATSLFTGSIRHTECESADKARCSSNDGMTPWASLRDSVQCNQFQQRATKTRLRASCQATVLTAVRMMWCRSRIRSRRLDLCRCCSNGEGARQWESLGLIQRADASPRWLLRAMSNATIKITYCDTTEPQTTKPKIWYLDVLDTWPVGIQGKTVPKSRHCTLDRFLGRRQTFPTFALRTPSAWGCTPRAPLSE
jgi:hypothetical protein